MSKEDRIYVLGVLAFLAVIALFQLDNVVGWSGNTEPLSRDYRLHRWAMSFQIGLVYTTCIAGVGAMWAVVSGRNRDWPACLAGMCGVIMGGLLIYAAATLGQD